MSSIGILAFGSLIRDPGVEIEQLIERRIIVQSPFAVEYARYSSTHGGAPTLVPHDSGTPVNSEILVLEDEISLDQAKELLWRRETRNERTDKKYSVGTSANSIVVGHLQDFHGLDHVIYTDFHPAGKVA